VKRLFSNFSVVWTGTFINFDFPVHEATLGLVIEELDRNKLRNGCLYLYIVNGIINLNVHVRYKS